MLLIAGFLEKNRDTFSADLQYLMEKGSKNAFVKKLVDISGN